MYNMYNMDDELTKLLLQPILVDISFQFGSYLLKLELLVNEIVISSNYLLFIASYC